MAPSSHEHHDGVFELADHAARNEYRIVLAMIPFPANPMDTNTGLARPGTVTRRSRMLYSGVLLGHTLRHAGMMKASAAQRKGTSRTLRPESTRTPSDGTTAVSATRTGQGSAKNSRSVSRITASKQRNSDRPAEVPFVGALDWPRGRD